MSAAKRRGGGTGIRDRACRGTAAPRREEKKSGVFPGVFSHAAFVARRGGGRRATLRAHPPTVADSVGARSEDVGRAH
jgi:hypothetical protein